MVDHAIGLVAAMQEERAIAVRFLLVDAKPDAEEVYIRNGFERNERAKTRTEADVISMRRLVHPAI